MTEDRNFSLKIITPDRNFYEGKASMVEFNTTEGEIGVYKDHVPTSVIVSPGILTITNEEGVRNAALHAGLAEILQDSVTVLAEIIEWPTEIDVHRAESAKERAESRIQSRTPETDIARAETALLRAVVRIESIK